MTCVIFLKHDNKLYTGCDTATSLYGDQPQTSLDSKVFTKGDLVFGFCGSFRNMQVVKYSVDFNLKEDGQSDFAYISNVANTMQVAGEEWVPAKESEGTPYMDASFLVYHNKQIYYISNDFGILPTDNEYMAIGSGSPYALGSLYTTDIPSMRSEPQKRIKLALMAAEKYSMSVRSPFQMKEYDL